jgi:uncharacterized membrane protein
MPARPKIKIEPTSTDQILDLVGWVGLLLLWALAAYNYASLPNTIPTHFNFAGQVDNYGSKNTILLLPLVGTLLFFAMTLLVRYPHIFNYPVRITEKNAKIQYTLAVRLLRLMKLAILAVLVAIITSILRAVRGGPSGMGFWFLHLVLAFLIALTGFYLYKSFRAK